MDGQLHQQTHQPSFTFNPNNRLRRDYPPRSFAAAHMNPNDSVKHEPMGLGMWSSPVDPGRRPRPQTISEPIHETGFSFCMPQEFTSLPAWDSSTMPMQPMHPEQPLHHDGLSGTQEMHHQEQHIHHDGLAQTYSVQQDFYQPSAENNGWSTKPCENNMDMQALDTDMTIGQAYTTDEHVPILDLRYQGGQGIDSEQVNFDRAYASRRLSGSSFTLSTTLSEMQSYEDFSTTLSEAPSFSSDYPPTSNRNSLMSSTQLSPVASPRMTPQNRSELVRTQSRGRASPSPRPSMRSAPYSIESTRGKRWSTGSYAPTPSRRPSPFVYHHGHETFAPPPRMSSRHSSPTLPNAPLPLNLSNLQQTQQHPFLMSNNGFHRNSMLLPSHSYHEPQFETPPPLLSHGLFRMLQSNADPHALHSHYTDLSDPPDLYASLHEEQIPPPPEDMNPSDPDMIPHEQELRFENDLYTPRWVRGHGNKREGWCGICKPGRWLVLKNSAFWYDKSFTHGISAATGSPFQEPNETRRMDGNPDVWEGLCGSCNDWVALVSSKKKGTTWFRHAYKCHTHPKIKDAPKRRRESSHTRALGANHMAKPKMESPMTPQSASNSTTNTPTNGLLHRKIISPLNDLSTMI
ncbi:hypothetical protein PVAG01_01864 [Phlyctema vagabunda]|uniref:Transcription regulator Rua1 C-terminal domain-containing protein n=1 Tax=Phlyctema vagabunda TaxID=108571 RepID=A0ABR4PYB5_9HELO